MKNKNISIIVSIVVITFTVIGDFLLHGIVGDVPYLLGFTLWMLTSKKFKIDPRNYLYVAFFLLMSGSFFAVYKMDWYLHRSAAWVFFIFVYVLVNEVFYMLKEGKK